MSVKILFICLGLIAALAYLALADSDFIPPEAKSVDGNLPRPIAVPLRPTPVFIANLEPLEELRPDQRLRLRLTVIPKHECDGELRVSVITKDGLVCDGPESWTGNVKTDHLYSKDLSVTIPNNDTSTIHILFHCEHRGDRIDRHFITTSDTVEFWAVDPRSLQKPPRTLYPWGPKEDSAPAERLEPRQPMEKPDSHPPAIDSTSKEKSQLEEMP